MSNSDKPSNAFFMYTYVFIFFLQLSLLCHTVKPSLMLYYYNLLHVQKSATES